MARLNSKLKSGFYMLIASLLCHFAILARASAIPSQEGQGLQPRHGPCERPIVRKEWRTLKKEEQKEYLDAVQCFLKLPGLTPKEEAPGAISRFDDLVATHIKQTFEIHYVGHFLPWHRFFTATYEHSLRTECSYTGAQPYWDWTLDVTPSSNFPRSPVFHPEFGFGGNGPWLEGNSSDPGHVPGRTGGGCVIDGPFKDMVVHLGPGDSVEDNPRCLTRDLSPYFAGRYLAMNQTELTLSQPDFGHFTRVDDGGPSFEASGLHGGGHYGVGGTYGQMGDLYTSPGDPIFHMHHANLDRLWWSWQMRDAEARLTDISGPIFMMDYDNLQGGNVTLDFPLTLGVNAENITVRETMDIKGGYLCYDYDKLY
ncbi:hypothetical protein AJ79_08004 [Helicocarpus griseus UAMH5409]|uniref:Tyrosinase copper-binding domain-containing protein n=1 Tax=Helicocarpus griseus UAMH5409 TaxID=1447875 RepID=A0A2B7WX14_9EURO|nr:hypothetical protein AJ79_08004 [Helicocarpus griseus UAMH5409]